MGIAWIRRRCSTRRPWPTRPSPALTYYCRRVGLRSALALGLLLGPAVAWALPSEFSARYEVNHAGFTLGEARTHFERIGEDRYRYSSLTRPLGIASLFYRVEVTEVSEGRITEQGFRPELYLYDRRGRGERKARITFDWDEQRVENTVDGQAWNMDIPENALDRMVSQLQLMHDLANDDDELSYRIADGRRRILEFDFELQGRERIKTAYGRLEAVKITRIEDDRDRATTFWCAPSLDYLPVRIDHRDKNDTFSMTLQELDGFPIRELAAGEERLLGRSD